MGCPARHSLRSDGRSTDNACNASSTPALQLGALSKQGAHGQLLGPVLDGCDECLHGTFTGLQLGHHLRVIELDLGLSEFAEPGARSLYLDPQACSASRLSAETVSGSDRVLPMSFARPQGRNGGTT
jgi:hypothetical protein